MDLSDEELFLAIRQGSQTAMEELVRRYHGTLFSYTFRQVRDYHIAQDLVQETFYRFLRFSAGVENPGAIKAWLYRVITNLINDWSKSASHRYEFLSRQNLLSQGIVSFAELLEQKEKGHKVLAALSKLEQIHRNVIYLRFFEDLSLEQIAEVLEIPLGTVKSRLHYGLKNLFHLLTAQESDIREKGKNE